MAGKRAQRTSAEHELSIFNDASIAGMSDEELGVLFIGQYFSDLTQSTLTALEHGVPGALLEQTAEHRVQDVLAATRNHFESDAAWKRAVRCSEAIHARYLKKAD